MDVDIIQNPNPSSSIFPFDLLPTDIKENIFSLLHITTLVVCKAVSTSWRSTIRSPAFTASYRHHRDDVIFFFCLRCFPSEGIVCSYLPSTDRWIKFPFETGSCWFGKTISPSGVPKTLVVDSIFKDKSLTIRSFPHQLLTTVIVPHRRWYYVLALLQESPEDYKIVVIIPDNGYVCTQTYDSRSGKWEPRGRLPGRFSNQRWNLQKAVWYDGMLFCLSTSPENILTFDMVGGQWTILDLEWPMPLLRCCHLLVFGGELYLIGMAGKVFEDTSFSVREISRIGIWVLNRSMMSWGEFDIAPAEYLAEFNVGWIHESDILMADCEGMVCFCNSRDKKMLMCDLAVRRWWWPRRADNPDIVPMTLTFEPHINLLK